MNDSEIGFSREKLLVLMIAPTPFYSGRGTHIRILHEAEGLAKRGHKVIIVTYHIGNKPSGLHPNIIIKRINRFLFWYTQIAPGPNWQKIFLDILLFIKVLRISIKKRPAILHGHLHEGVLIGWAVKKILYFRQIVLIGDFHGPLVTEMRSHGYLRFAFIQKIFRYIEKAIHRIAGPVVVSSPGLKEMIDKDRIKREAYVLSDAPTLNDSLKQAMNPTLGYYKSGPPCVVYTGGFTPDKGIENLFQMIRYSIQSGLSCRWVLAGAPMERLVVPLDIKNDITVISPLDHDTLSKILQEADVACDPKQGDVLQGSGKLLNYMQMGIPLVCFDGPAQRFYLGNELVPRFVAKDIPHAYAILKSLIQMPLKEKQELRTLVLKQAKAFSWSENARTLEQYYIEEQRKQQKQAIS